MMNFPKIFRFWSHQPTPSQLRLSLLLIVLAAFAGGSVPVAAKYALAVFHPFTVASLRFGLAVITLLPLVYLRRELSWLQLRELWPVATFGALNPLLLFVALQFTSASFSPLIYASVPAMTALVVLAGGKTKLTQRQLVGIGLGLLGVALVIVLPYLERGWLDFSVFGNLLIFLAAISFMIYGLLSQKKQRQLKISPLALTFYFCLVALTLSLPLTAWEFWSFGIPTNVTWLQWLSTVWAGVVGTSIFYLLYQNALKIGSAVTASLFTYLQPLFGISLAALLLGESITPAFLVGGVMALVGAGLANHKSGVKTKNSLQNSIIK